MHSRLFLFKLLCTFGLFGCNSNIMHVDTVYSTQGCVVKRLSSNLALDSVADRIDTLANVHTVTMPKTLLTKEFQVRDVYSTSHGYIIISKNKKHGTISVWKCTSNWQSLHAISNVPPFDFESTSNIWDPIDHRLAIVHYSNTASRSVEVGVINEVLAKYMPVVNLRQSHVEVGWIHGRLILVANDYSKQSPGYGKIALVNPSDGSSTLLYQESKSDTGNPGFQNMMVSPDQNKIAFDRYNPYPDKGSGIWILDIHTSKCFQVTFAKTPYYYHNLVGWKSNNLLEFYATDGSHHPYYVLDCTQLKAK